MTKKKVAIISVITVGVALTASYRVWLPLERPTSIQTDPVVVAEGKDIYSVQCAGCHGTALQGQPNWRQRKPDGKLPAPPQDASGHTWHHSDGDLFRIVKEGVQAFAGQDYKTDMPAFSEELKDDQIEAVIAYIKSTWPVKQRKFQEQVTASGQNQPND